MRFNRLKEEAKEVVGHGVRRGGGLIILGPPLYLNSGPMGRHKNDLFLLFALIKMEGLKRLPQVSI